MMTLMLYKLLHGGVTKHFDSNKEISPELSLPIDHTVKFKSTGLASFSNAFHQQYIALYTERQKNEKYQIPTQAKFILVGA